MKKWLIKRLVSFSLVFSAQASFAATSAPNLLDTFNLALSNDPQWLAYKSTLLATQENIPIARALLLPTISGTGLSQYNNRNNRVASAGSSFVGTSTSQGIFEYPTNNYGINLSQAIFNYADWKTFDVAKAGVKQATAQYGANYQQLMVTVAQDYFGILQARDVLNFTISERKSVSEYYNQNLSRYKVGIGTITDVYNAKAQLDNIISTEVGAQTNLRNAIETLRAITNRNYTILAGLKNNIPLLNPQPKDIEAWVKISLDQNLTILAARYAADAAKQTVLQQFGGHLPTLTGTASYNELHAGLSGLTTTNEGDGAAGVQLALPVYSGGGVVASTHQAQYQYQTALSTLEQTRRSTAENTRQAYNNVISYAGQIKSDKQALVSNQSSLDSMVAAFKVGTRTIFDVLQAQTQLFNTQVNYTYDLYSYLVSILELKQAAGTLSPQDIAEINLWLTVDAPLLTHYKIPMSDSYEGIDSAPTNNISPATKKAIEKELKNLPAFTPQPATQWTTPVNTSTAPALPSGALNTPINGPVTPPNPNS